MLKSHQPYHPESGKKITRACGLVPARFPKVREGAATRVAPMGAALFHRAPGRAHSLEGESPLRTRQGESLAGRQGCPSRGGIRRKPQAKRWPDEQKPHTRRQDWMRRQIDSKFDTCTESRDVYEAGISGKVSAQYPGRSVGLPQC